MLLRSTRSAKRATCDDIEVEAAQANCSAATVHVWSQLVTATVLHQRLAYSPTVTTLEYSDSIDVSVAPDQLYAMVSDPTRMGEWSPVCKACWWDEGDGPSVGAWFTGRNETPERTWESRCQVVAAEPGREFAWEVNNGWVRWGFTLEPRDGGSRLTESWAFLPAGLAGFRERWGDKAEAAIEARVEAAHTGIPVTLAAIKKAAEAS
jgi:hypothetical protein